MDWADMKVEEAYEADAMRAETITTTLYESRQAAHALLGNLKARKKEPK